MDILMRQTLNTATDLGGSAITSRDTVGTGDVVTMVPLFSPHSAGHFLRRNFLHPMYANHMNTGCQSEHSLNEHRMPTYVHSNSKIEIVHSSSSTGTWQSLVVSG